MRSKQTGTCWGRTVFRSGTRRLVAAIIAVGVVAPVSMSASASAATGYDAVADPGSMYSVVRATGAVDFWQAGYTGQGVDVAVIDSGVAPVDGLSSPGKVVDGPDLSFDSQVPALTRLDAFGHGTHMAGIIAGRAAAAEGGYADDASNFLGMAPDARIVSIKVAAADGATDVTQVIAAIDWVVQHHDDPGMNIRVLNLSYGTVTAQEYGVDPLAFAVEQAWNAGIVVVAAAGNAGFASKKASSMTAPAFDPHILAVGAADARSTFTRRRFTVPSFSSSGNKARRPDVVAPGAHVVSLRVPGSFLDEQFGATGAVTPSLFRGSGTSQATAVVSGAAALVLQQRPDLSPNDVKALLMATATKLTGIGPERQGVGTIDLAKALRTATPKSAKSKKANKVRAARGGGSLEASRGSMHVVHNGVALDGERDIFGRALDSGSLAVDERSGHAWAEGSWNGSTWSGSTWSGSTWSGSTWSGSTWSGSTWSGSTWSVGAWADAEWS